MSTRSATRIQALSWAGAATERLVDLYRHCDGYPTEAGADLFTALTDTGVTPYKTRADAITGRLLLTGSYELTADAENHGDLEWFYVVTLNPGSHAGSRAAAPVVRIDVYERQDWHEGDEPLKWPCHTFDSLPAFAAYVNTARKFTNQRIKTSNNKGTDYTLYPMLTVDA